MAQLIKLQDYISRYEWDTYRYPAQYIRQKKEQWERFYSEWLDPSLKEKVKEEVQPETEEVKEKIHCCKNGKNDLSNHRLL